MLTKSFVIVYIKPEVAQKLYVQLSLFVLFSHMKNC